VPGCYSYRPLAGASPAAGELVRVQLTDSATVVLRPYLGDSVVAVTGRFQGRTPAGIDLAVARSEQRNGGVRDWQGEPVTIPSPLVATAQARRLSGVRTVALAAGIVVAALVMRQAFGAEAGGGGSSRTPGGPR